MVFSAGITGGSRLVHIDGPKANLNHLAAYSPDVHHLRHMVAENLLKALVPAETFPPPIWVGHGISG